MTKPDREWWKKELNERMLAAPHSSYLDHIPAILSKHEERVRLDERLTCTEEIQKIIHDELRKTEKVILFIGWRTYEKSVARFALAVENAILSRLSTLKETK